MTVTALVVDDSETLRIALTGLLEEGGLKVLQAENGAQGVEVWQALCGYRIEEIVFRCCCQKP